MNPTISGALKSKTMWVSALTAAVGIVQYVQPFIPAQYVPIVVAASGVAGAILRTMTTQSLASK